MGIWINPEADGEVWGGFSWRRAGGAAFSSPPTWKGTGPVRSFATWLLDIQEMLSHEFGEWGYGEGG